MYSRKLRRLAKKHPDKNIKDFLGQPVSKHAGAKTKPAGWRRGLRVARKRERQARRKNR